MKKTNKKISTGGKVFAVSALITIFAGYLAFWGGLAYVFFLGIRAL